MRSRIGSAFWCLAAVFCLGAADNTADKWAAVAGGEFAMGDTYCAEQHNNSDWCGDETPHTVRLSAFAMQKHEVTNADYGKCVEAGACGPNELHETRPEDFNQPPLPAVYVTWEDAAKYCQWIGGRLPTEAEWERAAKVRNLGGAHFGQKYAVGAPRAVGRQQPNSLGLFDMLGNVYEWTADWYGPYVAEGIQVDPRGPASGKDKIVRGGSWNSPPHYLRAADRVFKSPDLRYADVGFRCVKPNP